MADAYLEELFEEAPDAEEIILDFKDITELESLLPLIVRFQHMKVLSLADNKLTELPPDLSCLTTVEEINLNGNVFEDLQAAVIALTTVPLLKSIHVNLHEEEQVDFIFRTMPNLQFLNDTEVEREELSGQYEEEESEGEELTGH